MRPHLVEVVILSLSDEEAFVLPGDEIEIGPNEKAGEGILEADKGHISSKVGIVVRDGNNGVVSVESSASSPVVPKKGDTVIGQVTRLSEMVAEVSIICVEGGPPRGIVAGFEKGDLFISEILNRFLPEPRDAVRLRDFLRAEVIEDSPVIKLSTKKETHLGVLQALCTNCGVLLEADGAGDWNVVCPRCEERSFRALSNGFGSGTHIPKGDSLPSALNREGEKWSPEVEKERADNRAARGVTLRNERSGRGGRPGGTPVKCTLCGIDTTVPFTPTPGKPVRCRDCMDKVKSGKASEDALEKESEALSKMAMKGRDRGDRRKRSKGNAVKCTLCGIDTTVPFTPTAGRPVRCRDCHNLVKDGNAPSDKLAEERKLLAKARGGGQRDGRQDGDRKSYRGGDRIDFDCTLCGYTIKLKHKPASDRPFRCRECMAKVEEGMVSEQEFSDEKQRLKDRS